MRPTDDSGKLQAANPLMSVEPVNDSTNCTDHSGREVTGSQPRFDGARFYRNYYNTRRSYRECL